MVSTSIEWTDFSWNPLRARAAPLDNAKDSIGWYCEHVSDGCANCYAEGINKRLGTGLPFKPGHRKNIEIFLDEKMLLAPLRWKKPQMIFACSMTDLFGDWVKDEWIDKIFAVMALCPQHTFQVLTKRAERMRAYMRDSTHSIIGAGDTVYRVACAMTALGHQNTAASFRHHWPLTNVWLGISAERQQEADERIPHLLETPAAVRFVSLEPLLGPIDLRGFVYHDECDTHDERWCSAMHSGWWLDWVIVGGESGPKARPMHPQWARALRDQCEAACVSFFYKQWGEWAPDTGPPADGPDRVMEGRDRCAWWDGSSWHIEPDGYSVDMKKAPDLEWVFRFGKRRAGRLLDGREHNDMPVRA